MKRVLTILVATGIYIAALSAQTVVSLDKTLYFLLDEQAKTATVTAFSNRKASDNFPEENYHVIKENGHPFSYGHTTSEGKHVSIPAQVTYQKEVYRVTAIGADAFYDFSDMKTVDIPESVTTIEARAFYRCANLRSVTIGAAVTKIGRNAFGWCPNLRSIGVDKSNPYFCSKDGVLFSKNQKTLIQYPTGRHGKYTIPDGVEQLGWGAFAGCRYLTGIRIPNSVTTLAWNVLNGCDSLQTVTLPKNVTNIGAGAFMDCKRLDSIVCLAETPPAMEFYEDPNGWRYYDAGVFTSQHKKSATLVVPNEKAAEAYRQAEQWKDFSTITTLHAKKQKPDADKKPDKKPEKKRKEKDQVIFARINGLCYNLFKDTTLAYLTFDKKHRYSSNNCVSLSIPAEIKYAGKKYTVIGIGDEAFAYSENLQSVVIPEGVNYIGYMAFGRCPNLQSVTLPDSMRMIEAAAFLECESLRHINLPAALKTIWPATFQECVALDSVYIPDGVTYIGDNAFKKCYALQSLHLPDSLGCISYGAFYGCIGLQSITIPKSVKNMLNGAFSACFGMKAFNAEDDSPHYCSIDGVLYYKDTTCITNYPMNRQDAVYAIPDKVKSIHAEAFMGSQLQTVFIPAGVTYIGFDAFAHCLQLKELVCYATTPPECPGELFGYEPEQIPRIYVPAESIELYRKDKSWGDKFIYLPCPE